MKHQFNLLLVFLLLSVCSCSKEQDAEEVPLVTDDKVPVYRLRFNADVYDYDGITPTTRSASDMWNNGDKVYLRFYGNSDEVTGVAIYDGEADIWNIQPDKSLTPTDLADCEATYFMNPSSATALRVSLTSESAIYTDAAATYLLYDDLLIVTAVLQPKTGRIRFKGSEGQNFSVSGLSHYTEYGFSNNQYKSKEFIFSSSVTDKGYSPFAHAFFSNENERTLTFSYTDKAVFKRTFSSETLRAGESGYMTIPTIESYEGWTLTNKETNQPISLPELSDVTVDPIRSFSATIAASVTSDGNGHLSDVGFVLSTQAGTSLEDGIKIPCAVSSSSLYVNQKNLSPETKYYVKAYAVNEKGIVLSEEVVFTTKQDPGGSSFETGGFEEENDWDK